MSTSLKNSQAGYYELLGLVREPFAMAPDPEFFYQTKNHGECLNRLEMSLRLNRGLHVVIGDVGTGKTTLSRLLLDRFVEFGKNYDFFLILNPTWRDGMEFLLFLKRLFIIKNKADVKTDTMNQVEHFLLDSAIHSNKEIVLLIDEGQKMGADQIEVIRTLLNFETNDRKLIQVVIFAQPEFQELVNQHENFKDRIAFGYVIKPLNESSTIAFIDHRLKVAGLPAGERLFTDEAKKMIHEHTKGYPRKIVNLCHYLIMDMLLNGKEIVDSTLVFKKMQSEDPFNV